ncbi:hypothetical protein [Fontisphaera persica]|uniref:hypothetical protein n=1 Tax=Fontisphaera persica TaxID=2974023 RepID=UPI003CCDFF68
MAAPPGRHNGPLDSDGDGLPDADEINLYGTNPYLADTDGDGAKDGDEVKASTNPLDSRSVFKLVAPPQRTPEGHWRLTWNTVSNQIYHLQRAWDDNPAATNWLTIASLTSTGATASYVDTINLPRRFYRVMLNPVAQTNLIGAGSYQFLPLDANQQPLEGSQIIIQPDGTIPPFELRLLGLVSGGANHSFYLRFPQGARLVSGLTQTLQFNTVVAAFGPDSAFRLAYPLGVTNGPLRSLPIGEVDVSFLVTLFGLPETNGLEVVLFDRFPLRILRGVFRDDGLHNAVVALEGLHLPLPGLSLAYPGFKLDMSPKTGLRLAVAGNFKVPVNSGYVPQVTVPASRPLWLHFKPDGNLKLGGRGEVEFPQGPKFMVDFTLDDPHYHLAMSAGNLHAGLLGSLADVLPAAPVGPATTDAATLNDARRRLGCFQQAIGQFSAATVGVAPPGVDTRPDAPDEAFATGSSVLRAWGFMGGCAQNLPAAGLASALTHAAQQAAAQRDLRSVVEQHCALMRLKAAQIMGGLQLGVSQQQELDAALAQAAAAVAARARSAEAVASLDNLQAVMQCLVELEQSRQTAGLPADVQLQGAMQELLQRFALFHTARLGVSNGVFSPVSGPIQALNRFAAMEELRLWVNTLALAQSLGLDAQLTAPVNEAMGQLGLRAWAILDAALAQAEARGDYAAFTDALEDALEFIALHQMGIFPDHPALAGLPTANTLNSFPARLETVFIADLSRPPLERSLANLKRDMVRLTGILRQLPPGFNYSPAPVQRAHERLEAKITQSFNVLSLLSLEDLQVLLEAGIALEEYRTRFNLAAATPWESVRLPELVTRLATKATQSNAWHALDKAMATLLAESDRLAAVSQPISRRVYLQQAAAVAAAARTVAVTLWQQEKTRRQTNPLMYVADLLLPGDIYVDRVAGSVRYHRHEKYLEGAFSGQLRLPKYDLSLTVQNASINTSGAFDLNLYGQVGIGVGANALGTLSILPRRPLRLALTEDRHLTLAGSGRVALRNGMAFEAFLTLDDPTYEFGFSASGLRFDLATNVMGYIPVIDRPRLAQLGPDVRLALNRFQASFSATAEGLSSLTDPPEFAPLGEPPDFSESVFTVSTDPLNAAASGVLLVLVAPAALGYVAADATAAQIRDATTPVVQALVRDLQKALRKTAQDCEQARAELATAAAGQRAEARRTLIRKAREAGETLVKVAEAGQKATQKQQAGALGTEGTNPAQTPEAQAARTAQRQAMEAAAAEPVTTVDPDTEIALLSSMVDYLATEQAVGGDPGQVDAAIRNYIGNVRAKMLAEHGMNEQGAVTNAAVFHQLTDEQLEKLLVGTAKFTEVGLSANDPVAVEVVQQVARSVLVRRIMLNSDALKKARQARYTTPFSGGQDVDGLRQEAEWPILTKTAQLFMDMQRFGVDNAAMPAGYDGAPGATTAADEFPRLLQGLSDNLGKRATYLTPESPQADRHYLLAVRQRDLQERLRQLRAAEQAALLKRVKTNASVPPGVLAAWQNHLNTTANRMFDEVRAWANASPVLQFPLKSALRLGRELAGLGRLLEETGQPAGPGLRGLARQQQGGAPPQLNANQAQLEAFRLEIFPKYTARVTALADAQKAWWILMRVNEVLLDGVAGKAVNDLSLLEQAGFAASESTLALGGEVLAALRQNVRLVNRPVDLSLPGDVVVERVSGSVYYRRDTGYLRGTFGGRLEFPDLQNAFFDISHATLDNQLNFAITAATAGPLPLAGARVRATVQASGAVGRALSFTGTGTLTLTNGPDFNVTVGFDTTTRTLSFDTLATELQWWRLTDKVVLFDAGFGFTLRPSAQYGQLRVIGSAGFFARTALATHKPPHQTNFYLFADHVTASATFQPGQIELTFSNGTLHLPEFFSAGLCPNVPAHAGPSVALNPQNPIRVTILPAGAGDEPELRFTGELDFYNLGVRVPEMPGLAAELCSARMLFSSSELPWFTNLNGTVHIPLPRGQTSRVDILNGAWRVDGFPSGKIRLANDVTLLNLGGTVVKLLGAGSNLCPDGNAFTVFPAAPGTLPRIRLDGAVEVTLPANLLTSTTGDVARATACGALDWDLRELPQLTLETVAFAGTFHLGGAGGLVLTNGSLTLRNLHHLFDDRPNGPDPFSIEVGGTLLVPNGPGFGLRDTKFVFNHAHPQFPGLPQFIPGTLIYDQHQWELANLIPFQVRHAELTFRQGDLPLDRLLRPTNLIVTISARLAIPPEEPVFKGEVNDLKVTFEEDGTPVFGLQSVYLSLDPGLVLTPISDVKGDIFIGGLDQNPPNPFFAGRVGGTYQTYQLTMLLAFTLTGPVGFCIDVNFGATGVPLGQTGFLWTGANGGYHFLNEFGDPCEFTAYINPETGRPKSAPAPHLPPVPAPKMNWSAFRSFLERARQQAEMFAQSVPGGRNLARNALPPADSPPAVIGPVNEFNIPCPDDCPPPTVNILCMPHPNQEKFPGKVVLKFSSIDEPTLNHVFGITQQRIQDLKNQGVNLSSNLANAIRVKVAETLPSANPAIVGAEAAQRLNQFREESLTVLEQSFREVLAAAINEQQGAELIYTVIRDVAEAGLPCPDVTFKVGGTFSYTGVSAFANVTGEGILGTTGSGGVGGKLNVLGVPMARAKLFVSATDAQGLPNPSVCGDVNVSLGPLELGTLRAQLRCDGCVSEMLAAFGRFVLGLSRTTLDHLLNKVAPQYVGYAASALPALLNDQQKIALLGEMIQLPPDLAPPGLKQMFINALGEGLDRLNPELRLCGEAKPKIFGIPLGYNLGGVAAYANKTNIIAVGSGSPAAMMAEVLGRTVVGYFAAYALAFFSMFSNEEMMFAYSVSWPNAGDMLLAGLEGRFRSPEALAAYLDETFDYVTENAIYSFSYTLSPMGLKSFDAQARVVMPNFTAHPAYTGTWVRPEDRQPPLPSRLELLLSALTNHLPGTSSGLIADPNWKGRAEDLFLAFPEGSPQRAQVAGRSFAEDYFPHGGLLGGAYLGVPRALYDAPPEELRTALNPNAPPLERLLSAITYVQEYILTMQTAGALGFYLPAPNPPSLTDTNGRPLSKRALLESINRFDFRGINPGPPYAVEQAFVTGYLEGKLLGVPIGRARLDIMPPDFDQGRPAYFRALAQLPPNQWLSDFTDGAILEFQMTQCPTINIERNFTLYLERLQRQLSEASSEAQMNAAAQQFLEEIAANLPKIKLEATLTNFHFPAAWSALVEADGAFSLGAYSPRYEPNYQPDNHSPVARARREGGLAFQGRARFKAGPVTLLDIANAEFSVLPKASGLPAVSAQLNAPVMPYELLTFRNVQIDFATDPSPRFSAAGELEIFNLGSFRLLPTSGPLLGGRMSVALANGQPAMSVYINPARLALPSLTGDTLLLHGETRNEPFTFSTTGPWNATVELTNDLNLLNIVRLGAGGLFSPMTLSGQGVSSASFSVSFGPSASVTLFPGRGGLERQVVLQPGVTGSLQVRSDGTFLLTATLGGSGLSFSGISVPAGASLQASQSGVLFTWSAGGVNGSLGLSADGTPTFNGEAELPPLNLGIFRLTGADGGNLRGAFNENGFAVNSGAKLTLLADWLQNQSLTLQSFTASNNGALDIHITSPGQLLLLSDYPFELTKFHFHRNPTNGGDGVATLALEGILRAGVTFPGLPTLNFTGTVSSAGEVHMGTWAPSALWFNFPTRNFSSSLDISAAQRLGRLRASFSLGDGAGLWALLSTNWFTGELNADGSFAFVATDAEVSLKGFGFKNIQFRFTRQGPRHAPQVHLEGDVTLPGFDGFRLGGDFRSDGGWMLVFYPPPFPMQLIPYPAFRGGVSLVFNQNGMFADGILEVPPLPPVNVTGNITNNGGFRLTGSLGSYSLLGFTMNGGTIELDRPAGGQPTLTLNGGQLTVPNLAGTHTVNGGFTNNGTFRLTGTVNSPSFNGLPVPGLSGAATLEFTHEHLSLTGNLRTDSGVLATVLPQGAAAGSIRVTRDGALQLSANLAIQPFTNNNFQIIPYVGPVFDAVLDNTGLRLAGGAQFKFGDNFATPLPLPAITLDANGNFSVSVGAAPPLNFTWRGFGISDARFTLERVGQTLRVPTFSGMIQVPHLGRLAQVSGSLNNDGTFLLSGSFGGSVSLSGVSPPLPVSALANGSLSFSHNGLVVSGNLSGGVLDRFPLSGSASGTLTITPGSVTLGGSVTLQPIQIGAFRIESGAGGGLITASWSANELRCPSNLRLLFDGTTLFNGNLDGFTLQPNGTFNISGALPTTSLKGFNLSGGTYQVQRTATTLRLLLDKATLSIPGFTTAFNVTMDGALESTGAFSLVNSSSLSGSFTPASTLPINFSGASAVQFDQHSLRVTGTFSGGALGTINSGISITGELWVQNNGVIIPSATFTLPELMLPDKTSGFHLAPPDGGNFQLVVDATGVRWPAGARLYYRNTLLGQFALPEFTLPRSGNFSITTPAVEVSLDSFTLTGSITLVRTNGVTTLSINNDSLLRLPGLGTSVNVFGTVTNNGTYRITSLKTGSLSLPASFPVAQFNIGSAVTLQRTGGVTRLWVEGDVSGGCLGGSGNDDLRPVNATATLDISSSGTLTLSGALTIQPVSVGVFQIEGASAGANVALLFTNNTLRATGARLRMTAANILDRTLNLPDFTIPADGQFAIPLSPGNLGVRNFPFTNVTCQLVRHAPDGTGLNDLSLGNFSGHLGLVNFGQRFTGGTLFSSGAPAFDWEGSLTLAGFNAARGYLRLRSSGLSAGGAFNLTAAGRTFHAGLSFGGNIFTDGTFSLTGRGVLSINNLEVLEADYTLNNKGISGTPTLRFGDANKLSWTPPNFTLISSSGVAFSHSLNWSENLSILGNANIASLSISASLYNTSGSGDFEVRLTGNITVAGNQESFNQILNPTLEFRRNFPPPLGPCVDFDLAPLRAKDCNLSWP